MIFKELRLILLTNNLYGVLLITLRSEQSSQDSEGVQQDVITLRLSHILLKVPYHLSKVWFQLRVE